MPTLSVAKIEGDVAELERDYLDSYTTLAGLRGRGKDWGIPVVILRHICAFGPDAMWLVDVYDSEQTMHDLIFERNNLPAELVPEPGAKPCLYDTMAERWEKDVRVMRVGKALPPLRTVLSVSGVPVRIGSV